MTSLIEHERIKTTAGKAKAMRPLMERVLRMVIKNPNNPTEMSKLMGIVKTPYAFKKLQNDLGPRYEWEGNSQLETREVAHM